MDNVARRARATQWVNDQKLSTKTIVELHKEACHTCESWLNIPEMKAFLSKLASVNTSFRVNEDGTIENRFYIVAKIRVNLIDEYLEVDLVTGDDFRPYGTLKLNLDDVMDFAKWRSTWQINK